jgi:hypothetical protein
MYILMIYKSRSFSGMRRCEPFIDLIPTFSGNWSGVLKYPGVIIYLSVVLRDSDRWNNRSKLEGIASGDESWLQYSSYSDLIFAGSRESVVARIRRDISRQTTMLPIFFPSTRLLVLEALLKGTKFNQDYLIDGTFLGLYNEKRRNSRKKRFRAFWVHMHNSMGHTGNKIS